MKTQEMQKSKTLHYMSNASKKMHLQLYTCTIVLLFQYFKVYYSEAEKLRKIKAIQG